jgi:hypothetical protein
MNTGTVKYFSGAGVSTQKRSRLEERGVEIVTQSEIIEERAKYQEVVRAIERWARKRNAIADKLKCGAVVEEGLYRAGFVDKECHSEFFGFAYTMEKLVIS